MGGMTSRRKGANAEREVAAILRDWLGIDCHRNWMAQAAQGGSDLSGLDGWAIEIKRAAAPRVAEWWEQTCNQAEACGAAPLLLYRIDGAHRGMPDTIKWRAMMRCNDISFADVDAEHVCETSLLAWMQFVRETSRVEVAA